MKQRYILVALFFVFSPLLVAGAPSSSLSGRDQVKTMKLIKLQAQTAPEEVLPAPAEGTALPPQIEYKNYRIKYWHHRTLRRTCCGCGTITKMALEVKDPCRCPVLVPVCVPGCCKDMPCISTGRDILGRFSYTYEWRSGYKVDVVFRPRGDVMVHSWGR